MMASADSFSVTFEIEPIVKLICEDETCQWNLVHKPGSWKCCALKHITIGAGGVCIDRCAVVATRLESA